MKFGKHIQSQQVPGWSIYYLDYKFLKKIISSLTANRPASEAAALALGVRPDAQADISSTDGSPTGPPIFSSSGQDEDRGPDFQAHRAAFFFKLERELEKINAFYLQKEAELTLRLETLLSKRRAAAMRGLPDSLDDSTQNHVEWGAVEEGFKLLERDLGKIQTFVEVNATGFRKILKKFDKRSTSTTKELYLARQVDIQPVFNRQLISDLSDTVATCLIDITDLSNGLRFEGRPANDILTHQLMTERISFIGPLHDLERNFRKAVASSDKGAIAECVQYSDSLSQQDGKVNITRILWSIIIEAPPDLGDLILSSLTSPLDFQFVDDINGRTCLHEAAIAGVLRLVDLCVREGVQINKVDVYGRSVLHYASMNGHASICQHLLEVNIPPNVLDMDNYTPLIYAILKGSFECVKVLLELGKVEVHPTPPLGDLIPLSLASQSGHVGVVLLLLQHGAQCVPNSNGEYPMHLAAREGHADVCKLLLHQAGWDKADKYHEWTPLFHAARYGHAECIRVLMEAGSRLNIVDELGHSAIYYAAWYGHHESVQCLSQQRNEINASVTVSTQLQDDSPVSVIPIPTSAATPSTESDIDMIPSLSLPPPIMPHRVYGHNYLDRSYLVQVTIGTSSSDCNVSSKNVSGVRLHPRLISPVSKDEHLIASTPLKLVMTTSRDVNSAPYSISLPQRDEKGVFTFQIPSPDTLLLEFSIYPNFGTKKIGRAVGIPSLFSHVSNNQAFTLPILDNRMHVIGEVSFCVNVIAPFDGVTLEVGGDVETYWKSMATPILSTPALRFPNSIVTAFGSTHTSPNNHSLSTPTTENALTVSSIHGTYVYVVVQVTRDLQPVVYAEWLLPETEFELGVADVTLAQFEAAAKRHGKELDINDGGISITEWSKKISQCMMPLAKLMTILPASVGVQLELAYPSQVIKEARGHYLRRLDLNDYVDSVLRTIYHTSASLVGPIARRKIVFVSFYPDVSSAINWKQPNYPVFFASQCGKESDHLPSLTASAKGYNGDRRLHSLGAAVEFAKINNLLGVFVKGDLLIQVPSLVQGIRNSGLLVGAFGESDSSTTEFSVDARIDEGVVSYADTSQDHYGF